MAEAANQIVQPVENRQQKASIVMMDIVRDLLFKMGRIKREFVSRQPSGVSEHMMMMVSPLLDRRRNEVGSIRVYVLVGNISEDIRVRVEWTRKAFGFWYQKDVMLRGSVSEPNMANLSELKTVFNGVKQTADGSTILKSMNRMYKKIKKSQVRDKAAKLGLALG
jgi:hypothetical protein